VTSVTVEDRGNYYETLEVTVGPKELRVPLGQSAEFQCSAASSGVYYYTYNIDIFSIAGHQ